jgi:hypothetical protein
MQINLRIGMGDIQTPGADYGDLTEITCKLRNGPCIRNSMGPLQETKKSEIILPNGVEKKVKGSKRKN